MINDSLESTTASDGTYTIPGIAAGNYGVSAIMPGYGTVNTTTTISYGVNTLNFTIVKNVMSGFVMENGSTPIAGAEVTMGGLTSTTDSNGYYSIAGVIAGTGMSISASQPDYASFVAGNLTVVQGDNTYNINLTPNSVSGTVHSSAGGNVGAGAVITIAGVSGTTDTSGDFTLLRVPAGTGKAVTISQAGYVNYTGNAVINSGSTNLTLTMNPNHGFRNGLFIGRRKRRSRRSRCNRRDNRHDRCKR